jgi:DhnA family fructose-bisphosphate aldolase class Ia
MKTDADVLELAQNSVSAGAAGLSFGRNVFQHANPQKISRALATIVHEGATAQDALRLLESA